MHQKSNKILTKSFIICFISIYELNYYFFLYNQVHSMAQALKFYKQHAFDNPINKTFFQSLQQIASFFFYCFNNFSNLNGQQQIQYRHCFSNMNSIPVSYSDWINFQQQSPEDTDYKRYPIRKNVPSLEATNSCLLDSALQYLKKKQQQTQQSMDQQLSNQRSSYNLSRQITPMNPLSVKDSKRRKNKNLNSVGSQLFEIQSQFAAEQLNNQSKKEFVLKDKFLGQCQTVYLYVFGKEKKLPTNLYHAWKQCLHHEDKTQILGNDAQYTHPKIFPLNQLEKGFKKIYGTGKNRALTAGQQATIISSIEKYLKKCETNPKKICRKLADIIDDILKDSELQFLQQHQNCIKQIEVHFMLMATKWKYSGKLNPKDKFLQSCLAAAKGNLVDLRKDNILTKYLKQPKQQK